MVEQKAAVDAARDVRAHRVYRHSIPVRVAHWVNVLCLAVLLMSGLQIFNAHPALYWGEDSDFAQPVLRFDGEPAFPAWITIPSWQDLATGRVWHFFFAWLFVINGLVYLGYSIASRHFSRDLVPSVKQLTQIGRSIREHLSFTFHSGEERMHYNVIQKLSYLLVILGLLPLMLLTGLTMSPAINAAVPWLVDLFDGRQSARTVHFIAANLLVVFVLVHVAMVVLSGFLNNMRSMITGWYSADLHRTSRDGRD